MKIWYLAGPMTGVPHFNFPLFHNVAARLRAQGYIVISPAETDTPAVRAAAMKSKTGLLDANDRIAGESWGDILSRDVKMVADTVDGIILLPGWENSRGASLEAFVGLLSNRPFSFARWVDPDFLPAARATIACTLHYAMLERLK